MNALIPARASAAALPALVVAGGAQAAQIALDEGTSLQALIGEAVDLLLKTRGITRAWRA